MIIFCRSILFFGMVSLVSCSNDGEAFCECIEAGEELNIKTQEFFDRAPNEDEYQEIESLKNNKEKLCEPYKDMDGEQMKELQKSCPSSTEQ